MADVQILARPDLAAEVHGTPSWFWVLVDGALRGVGPTSQAAIDHAKRMRALPQDFTPPEAGKETTP